jgi:DNA-binding NtrC family response regulator
MEDAPSRLRVLVVDDDWDFLAFIRGAFASDGPITVEVVGTPLEATWLLERDRFDVVVSDLHLGSSDGGHLLSMIEERWPRCARVLVTGFAEHVEPSDAHRAAQAVLIKPVDSVGFRDVLLRLGAKRM